MRMGAASSAPRPEGCHPPGDPALCRRRCEERSPARPGRGNPLVVPEAVGSPMRARCQHPAPRHVPSAVWQWGLAGGEAPGCRTVLALVIAAADNPRLGWAEALLLSLPAATGPALPAAAVPGLPPPRTPRLPQPPGQGWPRPRWGRGPGSCRCLPRVLPAPQSSAPGCPAPLSPLTACAEPGALPGTRGAGLCRPAPQSGPQRSWRGAGKSSVGLFLEE